MRQHYDRVEHVTSGSPVIENVNNNPGLATAYLEIMRVPSTGIGAGNVRYVTIRTPSRHLSASIEVSFQPDSPVEVNDYQTSTWGPRAMALSPRGGLNHLHFLDGGTATTGPWQNLPRSFEFDSAVRAARVRCNLDDPLNLASAVIAGVWYARAYWEPNLSGLPPELLSKLLAQCGLSLG